LVLNKTLSASPIKKDAKASFFISIGSGAALIVESAAFPLPFVVGGENTYPKPADFS
jgi:hypothetical protein